MSQLQLVNSCQPKIMLVRRYLSHTDESLHAMLTFLIKRIAVSIPVLIGVTVLLFIMMNIIPGDPIALLMKRACQR